MTPAPPYKEGPHRQAGRTRRLGEVVDNEAWGSGGQQRRCRGVPRTGRLGALRRRAGGRDHGGIYVARPACGRSRSTLPTPAPTSSGSNRPRPPSVPRGAPTPTWGPPGWHLLGGQPAGRMTRGQVDSLMFGSQAEEQEPRFGAELLIGGQRKWVTAHRSTRQRSRLAARAHHRRVVGIDQDDADGHKPPVLLHRVRRVLHLDHLRPAGAGRVRCPSGPWQPLRAWAWRAPSVLLVRST